MGILDGMMDFGDPNTMSMLGLAAGISNAARPSRMPIPLGAALGEGYQNAIQFRGEALKNQYLQQEIQQRGLQNALTLMPWQLYNQRARQLGKPEIPLPGMGQQQSGLLGG